MRVVLNALEKARKIGFVGIHVILDMQEVGLSLKGNYHWSINSIISDSKAFAFWFYFVDFAIILGHSMPCYIGLLSLVTLLRQLGNM